MKIYDINFSVDKNHMSFYYHAMVIITGGNGYVQKPSVLKSICCLLTDVYLRFMDSKPTDNQNMENINIIEKQLSEIQSKQIKRLEAKLKSKDKTLVGKTIKFYRLYYGISQKELARKLWTSFQNIQKYECGKHKITLNKLLSICEIIGINEEQFLDTVNNVDILLEILKSE